MNQKKYFSPINKNLQYLQKNTKKKKEKNKKSEKIRIQPVTLLTSNNIYSQKRFEKLLNNYNQFISKNFKNYLNKQKEENKEKDNVVKKLLEIKSEIETNIFINLKETNSEFNKFLESLNHEYLEENILYDLTDDQDFYNKENKLGLNKNNKNDYLRRRFEIFKEDVHIINEDLEYDQPIQEINIENNDINDINIQPGLNNDQIVNGNIPISDDPFVIINKNNAAKLISEIYKKKNKEKLYIGSDKNVKNITTIYGKDIGYKDGIRRIKTIEYNFSSIRYNIHITQYKSIKELFNVDYMTKEEILKNIPDIINKFKANNH